jgi:nitrogen fixation protein NifQ
MNIQGQRQKHTVSYYSALNLEACQHIISAQLSGDIILPHGLGLSTESYQTLRKTINNLELFQQEIAWYKEDWTPIRERAKLCEKLFSFKQDERDDLITLLCLHSNKDDPSSQQMAIIVASACLTNHHLWHSLGLQDRTYLGQFIQHNFPTLYALNTENMRWKRFFYRQLCQQDGDYICKAPSCGECKSYSECFAPDTNSTIQGK